MTSLKLLFLDASEITYNITSFKLRKHEERDMSHKKHSEDESIQKRKNRIQ